MDTIMIMKSRRREKPGFCHGDQTRDRGLRDGFRSAHSEHGLISDAVHNLSDIAAMIFSYWAEKGFRRPGEYGENLRLPQGRVYRRLCQQHRPIRCDRFYPLGAVGRLTAPPAIPGKEMLWCRIAFVGNGSPPFCCRKSRRETSI